MEIEIIPFNTNKPDNEILIGRTGFIRLKKEFLTSLGINKEDKFIFGVDEHKQKRTFLLIKCLKHKDIKGKKFINSANSYSIHAGPIIQKFNLATPLRCRVFSYNNEGYEGLKFEIIAGV